MDRRTEDMVIERARIAYRAERAARSWWRKAWDALRRDGGKA